jgi:hypothetical protein
MARPDLFNGSNGEIVPLVVCGSTLGGLRRRRSIWRRRKVQLVFDIFLSHGTGTFAGPVRLALWRILGILVVFAIAFVIIIDLIVVVFVVLVIADDNDLVIRLGLVSDYSVVS